MDESPSHLRTESDSDRRIAVEQDIQVRTLRARQRRERPSGSTKALSDAAMAVGVLHHVGKSFALTKANASPNAVGTSRALF